MTLRLMVAAVAVWLVLPTQAFAHAGLTGTTPKDGQTVQGEVSNIELTFSEAVRVTLVKVRRDAASQAVDTKSELPATFAQRVEVAVPALPPGDYDTQWTAVSRDGHVISGSFSFTVAE